MLCAVVTLSPSELNFVSCLQSKKKDKKDKKDKKGKDKEEEDNPMQYSKFMKGAYDSSGSSSSDEVRPA